MSYLANVHMFVRVYELGSMSAAARDLRVSPAVASGRISALEKHLGVRLFNRTTRNLQPTQHGRLFYQGANNILGAITEAEATVTDIAHNLRGLIHVAAPLGIGKRFIAPNVPKFKDIYPDVDVRLRLTDRKLDFTSEGLDMAFVLGTLEDSLLHVRTIAECPRVLCAAPSYIERKGLPLNGQDLIADRHDCLLLRFPGMAEPGWTLEYPNGPRRFDVKGPFESDDGDVLTNWALDGRGIINKPVFEVAEHIRSAALVPVATETPPTHIYLACLYPHKRYQEPKNRQFIDFMAEHCRKNLAKSAL